MKEYIERAVTLQAIDSNISHLRVVAGESALLNRAVDFVQYTRDFIANVPAADVVERKRGEWVLEAQKENSNYGWNVTAECSECCGEKKVVWRGLFPGVPDWHARSVALQSAESVKLSNFCPNCGADMREVDHEP